MISAKRVDMRTVCFSVSDTSIGMSSGSVDELFQPFSQADNSSTRRYGGAGLGLTVTKRFVELMNGEIQVESEPGRGATFHLLIPAELDVPAVTMSCSDC